MFTVRRANRFKKDYKLYRHDKEALIELEKILNVLIRGERVASQKC